jgi:hypothetical protein
MPTPPSPFKLLTQAVAKDIATQIINRYKVKHGLPAAGIGVILPPSAERTKNKARQAAWRIGKPRVTAWETADTAAILAPVKLKLAALAEAKRNYKHQLNIVNRAQSQVTYWTNQNNPARIATAQVKLAGAQAILAPLLVTYNAAKIP